MATRETPAQRGRSRGLQLQATLLAELRRSRLAADVSQREIAAKLGWSQTEYWRLESSRAENIGLPDLGAVGALLGLDLSAGLHPAGDPIADRGQQAVIARFRALLGSGWRVVAEALLPGLGERRAWDLLLRVGSQLVGVEVETRIRDVQALVRRIRGRERDGGVDEIVIVLADTRINRLLMDELREALGPRFATSASGILAALRAGRPVPGSGVVLM